MIIRSLIPLIVVASIVVASIVAGVFTWQRRRGRAGGAADWRRVAEEPPVEAPGKPATARGAGPGTLGSDLARWVGAGLISVEQADAIAGFERAAPAAGAAASGEKRVSVLAEALGYTGVVLVLAAVGVMLGQRWDDLAAWARLVIPAAGTALLILGGLLLRRQEEPAFRRLMSVLWALAVGGTAWALAVLGGEILDWDGELVALLVGSGCAVVSGVLWAVRRYGLQQVALFASLHVLVVSGLLCVLDDTPPTWCFAVAVWALGIGWAALGARHVLEPGWVAVAFGCLGAVVGPAIGVDDYAWLLAPALLTTAGLVALSVPTRQTALLALGMIGAFGYITWAVVYFFGDSLGVPVALVIVGAVFLALAVLAGSLAGRGRKKSEAAAG
ncbi:MAG: DUF2157 domain-containing protein [Actinobacteria bacterium]|nr:DUF2157 domain-containing protein [Actinomycetota bacterium]